MAVRSLQMFFSTATQYYVAGRFAALAGLNPVVGNLLHHAIEMYLKGYLSKTKSLAHLKKKLRHNLPLIWKEFKTHINDPDFDQFDGAVSGLHSFEELRYPDSVLKKGISCMVSIKRPTCSLLSSSGTRSGPEPKYDLCLEEIDELVGRMFTAASMNPKVFLGMLSKAAKQYLCEENSVIGLSA